MSVVTPRRTDKRPTVAGVGRSAAPGGVLGHRLRRSLRSRLVGAVVLFVVLALLVVVWSTARAGGAEAALAPGAAIVVLGAITAAIVWRLTEPLAALAASVRVGQSSGGADAVEAHGDEVAVLTQALSAMAADLEASRLEIGVREPARSRLLEKLINAQEEERKRIARELHDGVGQALLSLMVGLKLIVDVEDLAAAREKAEDLRGIVSESLEQVRMLSRELRPSVLDDLGLAVALDRYADEFTRRYPSVTVDVHCDLADRVPSVIETALYRIVQEAMTNAARHGRCGTIGVLLSRREGTVQAIIEDDGAGFDVETARRAGRSVGLHGMAERAELIGGALDIESGTDGTTVYVEVPV